MMRNLLAHAAATTALALSISVHAAEPAAPGAAATPPARTSEVTPGGPPLMLEAGKGTLIRLPRPANTVFVANPDVADVQIKSPSLIYITAKSPGETALYAVDAEDRVLLNRPVRVEHDLSRVRSTVHAVAPGENVTVTSVDNSLVLGFILILVVLLIPRGFAPAFVAWRRRLAQSQAHRRQARTHRRRLSVQDAER